MATVKTEETSKFSEQYPLTTEEAFPKGTGELIEKAHANPDAVPEALKKAQAEADKVWDVVADQEAPADREGPITQNTGANYPL